MFSLLSKTFEALKTGGSVRRPQPLKLVRPSRQPNIQYYGYMVTTEWLIQFAEQHCPGALLDRRDSGYEFIARTRGYEYISAWSRICYLGLKECFNLAVIPADTVMVFAVFSDQEESFEERPTQETVDFMTKSIGHPPQWWASRIMLYELRIFVAAAYRAEDVDFTTSRRSVALA
ncbi:uncharacterized protein EDB91DRAFT_1083155 [Suillus paluster]|uniref:uncharacterized protein n=1 Tax=Suillus paluster TaxID=48578 RepID=UPI001B87FBD9|nr:uncharacterized protein EDB91DRAFT_1083155 [Suillus paluster]KAG1737116.1 hypothetical protein EDB91DRAFT_1083155 [Suillus paluster]